MPFEELSHTADWSLRVWADDLTTLFMEAARGLNTLAGIRMAEGPPVKSSFSTVAMDKDGLLVAFLSELIYYIEKDGLAFTFFDLSLTTEKDLYWKILAEMQGAPILSLDKVIKAVTWHKLQIHRSERGMEVEIIFDV